MALSGAAFLAAAALGMSAGGSTLVASAPRLAADGTGLSASTDPGPQNTATTADDGTPAPAPTAAPTVTLNSQQVTDYLAQQRAAESPDDRAKADQIREQLTSDAQAVYDQAQAAGSLAGTSPQGQALRTQLAALPPPAEQEALLARVPDPQLLALSSSSMQALTSAGSQLGQVHAAVTAEQSRLRTASGSGTSATTAQQGHVMSAHDQGTTPELLGVTPAAQPTDDPEPDCPDYPGGGQTPDDNERAIDGLRAIDGYAQIVDYVVDVIPEVIVITVDIIVPVDFSIPNPLKIIEALFAAAIHITSTVYDGFITRAASCQDDGVNIVLRDTRRDLDHLTSSIGTVLGLDEAVAGLLDGRTQAIEQLLTNAQAALEADEAATQSAVEKVTTTTGVSQQAVDAQARQAIEGDLAGDGPIVVADELPMSQGGYLDAPDGVRDTITSLRASMDAAGIPYDPAALRDLSAGNKALAAGEYVAAHADYRRAYSELMK